MFKGTMTKWPVQKLTQGTTQKLLQHHDATDIQTNYMFVFLCKLDSSITKSNDLLDEIEKGASKEKKKKCVEN